MKNDDVVHGISDVPFTKHGSTSDRDKLPAARALGHRLLGHEYPNRSRRFQVRILRSENYKTPKPAGIKPFPKSRWLRQTNRSKGEMDRESGVKTTKVRGTFPFPRSKKRSAENGRRRRDNNSYASEVKRRRGRRGWLT